MKKGIGLHKLIHLQFLTIAFLLVVLAGCSKDESGNETGRAMLTIKSVEMQNITTRSEAVEKQEFAVGDNQGVAVLTLEKNAESATRTTTALGSTIKYRVGIYDSGGALEDEGDFTGQETWSFDLTVGAKKIVAVSYNDATTVPAALPANIATLYDISAYVNTASEKDVLLARHAVNLTAAGADLSLNFEHALAKISVVANSQVGNITAASAILTNMTGTAAKLNLETKAVTVASQANKNYTMTQFAANRYTSSPLYVVPGTLNDASFTATIGGTGVTKTFSSLSMSILAGNSYTLAMTYYDTTSGSGDNDAVIINGLEWAKGNLYETATPGEYKIFDKTEQYSGAMSGGDYWNYGAVHPRTDNSSYAISSGVAGTDYVLWDATVSEATDPCRKALGGTWRMPTSSELFDLANTSMVMAANIKEIWGSLNSVNGMWFFEKFTGAKLFLPAAGYRQQNQNDLGNVGSTGYYWSSNRAFEAPSTFRAGHVMSFSEDAQYGSAGATTGSTAAIGYRDHGQSIRCVRPVTP